MRTAIQPAVPTLGNAITNKTEGKVSEYLRRLSPSF